MTNFQLEPTQTDIPIYPRSLVGVFADPYSARKRQLFPILWTSVTLIRLENKSPFSCLIMIITCAENNIKIEVFLITHVIYHYKEKMQLCKQLL